MRLNTFTKSTVFASIAIMLSACGIEAEQNSQAPQAPEVSVAQVVSERFTEWDTFTGRLEAPESVDLRPRVSGYIERVAFDEGAYVSAGDPLFFIDDRPFKAEVQRYEAALKSANAQLKLANSEYRRAKQLIARKVISTENFDTRLAQLRDAQANVDSVTASLALAELQLSYTRVEAPISGRVSRAMVTKGNYVAAGQSMLTSLVSTDKVYAYFDADEQTYLKYTKLDRQGLRPSSRTHENPVFMGLANDKDFPHEGYIDFVDNRVNPASGTIRGRAVFENTDGSFIPGLFARIKLVGSASYQGILIDDKAVGTDLNNKFVLVLGDDNVVQYRAVQLGEKVDGLRIVKAGLQPSDRIVVNGLQRVRPGTPVSPISVEMAPAEKIAAIRQMQESLDQSSNKAEVANTEPVTSPATATIGG